MGTLGGQGGSLWTLTQKTHIPTEFFPGIFFLTNFGIYQDYSKTLILTKEKLKNNVQFRKKRQNIDFHVVSFWAMTILISHFLGFGALKISTGDYFVLRINQITYSKQKKWFFIHFSIFPSTFPAAVFPIDFVQVAYKWRMDRITYQQVND